MKNTQNAYYVGSAADVLYLLKNVSGLVIFGGCTGLAQNRHSPVLELAESFLTLRNVPELKQITKTERHIEFGSAVTLEQILALDIKKIPQPLHQAIESMSNPYIRSLATLTGNICVSRKRMTAYAPLLAMDTKVEIQGQTGPSILPLAKFTKPEQGSFVSKIIVPTEDWDVSVFERIGDGVQDKEDTSFCFLASTKKSLLTDVRITFCGSFTFRSRELENSLIGSKLPLTDKSIEVFSAAATRYFSSVFDKEKILCPPILASRFINLLRSSLQYLT